MNRKQAGFTIVEVVVVIAVVAILATIGYVTIGNWHSESAKTEVKNDLLNARSALENHRNFADSYPANGQLESVYRNNSDAVTLTYALRPDGASYCLQATSLRENGLVMKLDSAAADAPVAGSCA